MDTDQTEAGTVESQADYAPGMAGIAERMIAELNLSDEIEKEWRAECHEIELRFRNERPEDVRGFNILASNVKTLEPAVYNQAPKPDFRRRHKSKDDAGKILAQVAERAVVAAMDEIDFDEIMEAAVQDYLLPGRAVVRLRYEDEKKMEPQIERLDAAILNGDDQYDEREVKFDDLGPFVDAEPIERVVWERVLIENVPFDDFRRSAARNWGAVDWVAFRHQLTKDEIKKQFGARAADRVPLGEKKDDEPDTFNEGLNDEKPVVKTVDVWEVWHKTDKKVYWICKGYPERPLKVTDPPLELRDFFPMPRPLYSMPSKRTLVPVPEYRLYRDQAEKLDTLTRRIAKLEEALKLRGVYDATLEEIGRMFESDEADLIAAKHASKYADKPGGLANAITYLPIKEIAAVLLHVYQAREQAKQAIYEITGISDIIRGASDSAETATAQGIKARFGSMRISRRQALVQRFARDIVRLMTEIMVENFAPTTVEAMAGMAMSPEAWKIAQNDQMRGWRVDIETDSTIAADAEEEKKNITELLSGITNFLKEMLPAVIQGAVPREVAQTMLMAAVRRFKLGREIEDVLEQWGEQAEGSEDQQQQQQPDPRQQAEQQAMQQQVELEQMKAKLEAEKVQRQTELAAIEHELELKELRNKAVRNERAHQIAMREFDIKAEQRQTAPTTELAQ